MPSLDERREVAARLREEGINLYTFAETFGFSWEEDGWRWSEVAAKVADLIEPEPERTCRFEWEYKPGEILPRCSVCKKTMGKASKYCSNCGAKVVE